MQIEPGTKMTQTEAARAEDPRRDCKVVEILDDGRYVIEIANLYHDRAVVPPFYFEELGYEPAADQRSYAQKLADEGRSPNAFYEQFVGKRYYDVADPERQIVVLDVDCSHMPGDVVTHAVYTVKYEKGEPRKLASFMKSIPGHDWRIATMLFGDLIGSSLIGGFTRWIEIEGAEGVVSRDPDHEGQVVLF
jgi:hypothetical protein